jgi:hypothetical protein
LTPSPCRESNAPPAVVESIVGHSNPAMTRHYTHIGEVAAGQAVAALPSILSDTATTAPQATSEETLSKARAIVESMTAKNWREKKTNCWASLCE